MSDEADFLGEGQAFEARFRRSALARFAVARAHRKAGLETLADKISGCCLIFDADVYDTALGVTLQFASGERCRVRGCPTCDVARSRKLHYDLADILSSYVARRRTERALFLTLTKRDCEGPQLGDTVSWKLGAFRKLMRLKPVKQAVTAWFRSVEVTVSETGKYHPHIHVLLMVQGQRYFSRAAGLYITQEEWAALWAKCLGVDYTPIVDIRVVDGIGGGRLTDAGRKALREVTKYLVKPASLIEFDGDRPLPVDPDRIKTLHFAMRGRRLVAMSRAFRDVVPGIDPDAKWSAAERIPEDAIYRGRERRKWGYDSYEVVELFTRPNGRDAAERKRLGSRGRYPKWAHAQRFEGR